MFDDPRGAVPLSLSAAGKSSFMLYLSVTGGYYSAQDNGNFIFWLPLLRDLPTRQFSIINFPFTIPFFLLHRTPSLRYSKNEKRSKTMAFIERTYGKASNNLIDEVLISSDSHVIEPAGLWQKELPKPYKDRARSEERRVGKECRL